MFIAINKKSVIIFCLLLCVVIVFVLVVSIMTKPASTPMYEYTIVIDAGHGGIDGGVVGVSGETKESDINLEYALRLGEYFESMSVNVVYTRTTKDGLYSAFSDNKKADDMKERQKIIEKAKPDLVISIHQNGYISPNQRGITAFFNPKIEASKQLATIMQDRFKENIEHARSEALAGDYYILNCTNYVGVLVECGFLTNAEDEALLKTKEYKEKVCYQIFSSVIKYLVMNDILLEDLNAV